LEHFSTNNPTLETRQELNELIWLVLMKQEGPLTKAHKIGVLVKDVIGLMA